MDTDTELQESIKEVMQSLPPVLRAYVAGSKYTPVAQNLMRQYRLRIDQGGVLERELLLLLLGLETPADFSGTLATEGNMDKTVVDGIMRDVNNQIFVPLRAEEMKASAAQKAPASPATFGDSSHFHLENKIPLPARPAAPRPMTAQPARPDLRSALSQALGTKSLDPSRMLEDHEEPHIDFNKRPPVPAAAPMPPARTASPPPNLPGQLPASAPAPRVIPPGGRAPVSATPAPAAPKAPAPPAGLTFRPPTAPTTPGRYQVDPYREPIEEEEGK